MSRQTTLTTIAILLARGGSKGVPNKNLKTIGGRSLVRRSVEAALQARQVAHIYVSTDEPAIAAEGRAAGARIIDRPPALADDGASSESGWLHALEHIRADFPDLRRLVFLQCTSPFTTGDDIDGCLNAMAKAGADCAFTAIRDHGFLWRVDGEGLARGINHDETTPRQRRQDLAPQYRESGAVYCALVEPFEKTGQRFCGKTVLFPVDHPPLDIDTPLDLSLCEAYAQMAGERSDREPTAEQLRAVNALVMDFDGVHTDDRALIDQDGREAVLVSRSDGMGLERLRRSGGCATLILSKERNLVVTRRAEKLKTDVLQATDDKVAALDNWLAENALQWRDVLYVGNDLNDLEPIQRAGLSAAPRDAQADVLADVDWVVPIDGGKGVIRHIADALIKAR